MAQGLVQQDDCGCGNAVPDQRWGCRGLHVRVLRCGLGRDSLDQAATWARKGLLISHPGEWATPVLFSRAPDGRVFDEIIAARPTTLDHLLPEKLVPRTSPRPSLDPYPHRRKGRLTW